MEVKQQWVLRDVCKKVGFLLGVQNFEISYKIIGEGTFAEGNISDLYV